MSADDQVVSDDDQVELEFPDSNESLPGILPCPFCGGIADYAPHWHIECQDPDCAAYGPSGVTIEEAISLWNKAKR